MRIRIDLRLPPELLLCTVVALAAILAWPG